MRPQIDELLDFYSGRDGRAARRIISRIIMDRWGSARGLAMAGIGFAVPFLADLAGFRARCLVAVMPGEQGGVHWSTGGGNASLVAHTGALPFRDCSLDRVLLVHALEYCSDPRRFVAETGRVLVPGGRVIIVVPNRSGLWAYYGHTPWGSGTPYNLRQIMTLLGGTVLRRIHTEAALAYPPPVFAWVRRHAGLFERYGPRYWPRFCGVLVVEAEKHVHEPVLTPVAEGIPVGRGISGLVQLTKARSIT